jgi:hypothetical protein
LNGVAGLIELRIARETEAAAPALAADAMRKNDA